MFGNRPVLLIEDGQTTSPTVGAALKELGIHHGIIRVSGSAEARAFLNTPLADKPALILIDSASSKADLLDLVKAVKADETSRNVPVIVLSPSGKDDVVNVSFDVGAAGYVVKPSDRKELANILRGIHRYWILSRVPSDTR